MSFTRVTKNNPCPICGKPDWCSYNNIVAVCMRIQSQKTSENGGWVHRLNSQIQIKEPEKPKSNTPRKPDIELDKIYRRLLDMLPLNKSHFKHLKNRGMSNAEIGRGLYKSLPEDREIIVSQFSPNDLAGIPGFGITKKGQWVLSGNPGLLIPVIQNNLIVSLLIRPDKQEPGKKYKIMSSSWLEQGCKPGMRVHVAIPSEIHAPNTVWIVEGPLKGNIVAERVGAVTYAVPGVNSWRELRGMAATLPEIVVVAYDSDYENFHVRYHARKLSNFLIKNSKEVYAALWDKKFKGPDDALVAETTIKPCRLFWRALPKQSQAPEKGLLHIKN